MSKASILIFAALATLLSSCGDESPTNPEKDYYCSGDGKTYSSDESFSYECPDVWCEYTGTLMTHWSYNKGFCKPQVSAPNSSSSAIVSSSSRPRSSSSARPRSSSSTCQANKCECSLMFKEMLSTSMKSAACAGLGEQKCAESVARQVGCTL